ncbi:TPA: hypothetical protein DEP58_01430 [Patescibacteria group bacterium]|nr:MAG: hypothetical protein UU98_C0010G0015 [Parcubacteria group bacterium GW2011_GWD2_42_14]HCC04951.1 hypothetical protein [Patescibacteria group bacterium]
MANSNIQLVGLPSKLFGHFQRAQKEIDTCLKKGFSASSELLHDFSHYGNTYAINLDGVDDSVVHEDVVSARIFPRKDYGAEESFFKNEIKKYSITELEKNIVLVSKKLFEVVVLVGNLLVVFLLKLDTLCERLLTTGNAYVQAVSETSEERRRKIVSHVVAQADIRREVHDEEPILLYDATHSIVTPPHTITQLVPAIRRELPNQFEVRRSSVHSPVLNMFVYTLTVLYNELRYGAKSSMQNIDSI